VHSFSNDDNSIFTTIDAVTPTAACVTRKPHSRAHRAAKRRLSETMTFMGPYCVCIQQADRFIKHPGCDSLIATNQLNWIVWAQCFNDRRCWEGIPSECNYGSVLPHQDRQRERERERDQDETRREGKK